MPWRSPWVILVIVFVSIFFSLRFWWLLSQKIWRLRSINDNCDESLKFVPTTFFSRSAGDVEWPIKIILQWKFPHIDHQGLGPSPNNFGLNFKIPLTSNCKFAVWRQSRKKKKLDRKFNVNAVQSLMPFNFCPFSFPIVSRFR